MDRDSDKLFSSYIKEQQNAMLLKEKGRVEGVKEGRIEMRREDVKRLLNEGWSAEKIINFFRMSSDEVMLYFGDAQTV